MFHCSLRLVEEVKDLCGVSLENEEVYMNTSFEDFTNLVILKGRGAGGGQEEVVFNKVVLVRMHVLSSGS